MEYWLARCSTRSQQTYTSLVAFAPGNGGVSQAATYCQSGHGGTIMTNKPLIAGLASVAETTRSRRRSAADHRFIVAQQGASLRALVETNRIARIQQKRSCELALNGTLVKAPTTNTTKRSRELCEVHQHRLSHTLGIAKCRSDPNATPGKETGI